MSMETWKFICYNIEPLTKLGWRRCCARWLVSHDLQQCTGQNTSNSTTQVAGQSYTKQCC
jgi:hypothetical protein